MNFYILAYYKYRGRYLPQSYLKNTINKTQQGVFMPLQIVIESRANEC